MQFKFTNYLLPCFMWLSIGLLSFSASYAQGIQNLFLNAYANGNVIRLDFMTDPPSVSLTSIPGAYEGIAHFEKNGEILFWLQADGVYNTNGNFMSGSNGIFANTSSAEMCISPDPSDPNRYYVIYNDETCSSLYYSVVDMTLDGGLGDVIELNTLISNDNFGEGLEVVNRQCSDDFWLLAYKCGIGFTRFTIDGSGITDEQLLYSFDPEGNYDGRGELDYHRGRIGAGFAYSNKVFVSSFDPYEGEICDAIILEDNAFNPSFTGSFGVDFSPSGNKMYFSIWYNTGNNQIYQYDFDTDTYTGYAPAMGMSFNGFGEMELGADGKIYVMMDNLNRVMVIDNPDDDVPIFNYIFLPGPIALGLSDHIQSYIFDDGLCNTDSLCFPPNSPLELSASSSDLGSYTWTTEDDPNTVIGTTPNLTTNFPNTTTIYNMRATSDNACFNIFDQFTVFPIPEVDAGPDLTITEGESIQLQSTSFAAGASIIWFPGGSLDDPFIEHPIASPTETTTYFMSASIDVCQANDQITITVLPLNIITETLFACGQGDETVALTLSDTLSNIEWYNQGNLDIIIGSGTTFEAISGGSGDVVYVAIAESPMGNEVQITYTLTANPQVSAGIDQTVTEGNVVSLQATDGVTYNWTPSTGLDNPTSATPTFTATETTTYTVTSTTAEGCTTNDEVTINVIPLGIITDELSTCGNSTATITLMVSDTLSAIQWYDMDNPSVILGTGATFEGISGGTNEAVYLIEAQAPTLGNDVAITYTIIANPQVNAGSDQSVIEGNTVSLQATNGIAYSWTPSTGLDNPTSATPTFTAAETTTYTVTSTTAEGCTTSDEVNIVVNMPLPSCLIVPTAFSPNNDGKNDLFRITSQSINAVNVFQVFNRWGDVIWEGATPDAAWDGTYKNELQEMGAYPYYIEAVCEGDGNVEIAKGYILLIR